MDKDVKIFKRVLRDLWTFSLYKSFEKKEFDEQIARLINADLKSENTYTFTHSMEFHQNDILFINLLLDRGISNKFMKKIKKIWGLSEKEAFTIHI